MFYSALKTSLRVACYFFCALTLAYSLIMLVQNNSNAAMSVITVFLFYPFSFIIVFSNLLLRGSKINGFFRELLRYLAFILALILCIGLPHRAALTGASSTILIVFITIVYIICRFVTIKCKTTEARKETQKAEYQSVYTTENEK